MNKMFTVHKYVIMGLIELRPGSQNLNSGDLKRTSLIHSIKIRLSLVDSYTKLPVTENDVLFYVYIRPCFSYQCFLSYSKTLE